MNECTKVLLYGKAELTEIEYTGLLSVLGVPEDRVIIDRVDSGKNLSDFTPSEYNFVVVKLTDDSINYTDIIELICCKKNRPVHIICPSHSDCYYVGDCGEMLGRKWNLMSYKDRLILKTMKPCYS